MSCNRAQQGLQFLGVHAICGHQGANDGIGQHLLNGYFGALWHRTLMILSNCPQRAKNADRNFNCEIASMITTTTSVYILRPVSAPTRVGVPRMRFSSPNPAHPAPQSRSRSSDRASVPVC